MTTTESPRRKVAASEVVQELGPGQSLELLRELHLLTRGGDMNADALRKLKQINHLMRLLAPAIGELFERHEQPQLVDAGAGNAWLGLLLHEAVLRPAGRGQIIGIERRADLVTRAEERATRLRMEHIRFTHADVAAMIPSEGGDPAAAPIHAVLALHACDRATDEAILLGLRSEASVIAVVPCCQAEIAALLQGEATHGALAPLWRHGLHRRELGAHLTNVIRALVLEAHGYKVRVTELVGWEHSLKNELIVAIRHQRGNNLARRQLQTLLAGLPPLPMWLLQQTGLATITAPTASATVDEVAPAGD